MNLKAQTTPEAVSTDNRILLKSHARFFIVPAAISCLLLAAVSIVIFMNIEVPDSFSAEILMGLVPLLFLVRIVWQIPDYIRFEASSALSSKYTDYLFWIRPKGFRERPLFAVTEDAAATEYYFILQNELGIPMRQD
ncbi:MAG: hypothetical protein ACK5CH_09295 [Bacteroidota bacterium]|jgi:hypothetical protein